MADVFSTNTLNAVVRDLKLPPSFFLDRYFPQVQQDESEEIHFDIEQGKRRITPFCSPVVAGRVVEGQGQKVSTFKPAYLKDKRQFQPGRALKRTMGEQIGGSLSTDQRMQAIVFADLTDMLKNWRRRLELMAATVLSDGKITIAGDDYPSTLVDFLRDAALSFAPPAVLWTVALASTSKPLDDLLGWQTTIIQKSGVAATDVIMDVDAWKGFRSSQQVGTRLNQLNGLGASANLGAPAVEGGQFMGSIDGFNIYVYQSWYVDSAGAEQPFLNSGRVIITSSALEGVQQFGAIQDLKAMQAVPFFTKSWEEEDPSVRFLLGQSAPLVVPYRVNACASVDVN